MAYFTKSLFLLRAKKMPAYSRPDRYVLKDGSQTVTVIRCRPMEWTDPDLKVIDGVTPMPGTRCDQTFSTKVLNGWVEMHYPRNFLPPLREMEEKVDKRLKSFISPN